MAILKYIVVALIAQQENFGLSTTPHNHEKVMTIFIPPTKLFKPHACLQQRGLISALVYTLLKNKFVLVGEEHFVMLKNFFISLKINFRNREFFRFWSPN